MIATRRKSRERETARERKRLCEYKRDASQKLPSDLGDEKQVGRTEVATSGKQKRMTCSWS